MKTSNMLALAFAVSLAGPIAAYAAGDSAKPIHHYYHHFMAHRAAAPAATAQFPLARFFAPARAVNQDPNDIQGLSRHRSDCNKGCIDNNG